ncbi:MAG: tetratricopeptide repeat protein [Candidatus Poribacteria bacterium]|nr:tetratricopeptide repeat protein [Candidatus Poribacteria bacterium]
MIRKLSYYTVAWVALVGCYLTLSLVPNAFCQETGDADPTAQIRAYKAQLTADGTQTEVRLKLAKVYLQIEAYTEAITEYQQIIAIVEANGVLGTTTPPLDSDIPTVYYGLGLAYTGLERFEDAITAYERSIAYQPDWAYSHAALASAYANMHRYAEALDAYKVAIGLNPNDEMIHHQLGNVYSKRGEHAAAIRHQQQAIAIAPEFAEAHYQLGLLYTQKKQWTDAIASYQTAYAHDDALVEVLYNLAQAYLRVGDTSAARQQMALFEKRKAVITPLHQLRGALQRTQDTNERAQILANIGRIYLKDGHYEKAVWEYQKALGIDPQLASAYNGLGLAYTMLERYSEAVIAQRKALELQPDLAKAYAGLGLTYFRQNLLESALEHYRHAVALDPEFLEARLKIGIILLNQKHYAEAIDTYLAILDLKPDDPEVYYNLGLCYAHQAKASADESSVEGLTFSALTTLEKAVALSVSDAGDLSETEQPPFLAETYYLIGELQASKADFNAAEKAYLASGLPKAYHALAQLIAKFVRKNRDNSKQGVNLETARRYAQEAVRLDPNVASYYNTLALIDFQRGDYPQAEKAIRKALELEPKNPNYQQGLKQISGKLAAE